jgi:hypothetical protein
MYLCNELKNTNNECVKVCLKSLEVANQQSSSKTQKKLVVIVGSSVPETLIVVVGKVI